MQKITPFLWFDGNAEEAMRFYTSVFKNAKVVDVRRFGSEGPGPEGSVMTATFQIEGQEFVALNGGPHYQFTPAISFFVNCETQEEVDDLWAKLSDGGCPLRCGWITDKYGITWQIVPSVMMRLLQDEDPEKAGRTVRAMLEMVKLDGPALQRAHDGV